ncbi:MAG: tetratricopeptide repeat protein [Verrucomicrobiota bacterium]
MRRSISILFTSLSLSAGSLFAQAELPAPSDDLLLEPSPSIMDDPEWQKRFLGSYGFLPALEPKVNQDELEILRDLIELMKADAAAAATQLSANVNAESSPALVFILGNLYFQEGQLEEAKKYYLQAVERHPDFRRAHKNLGLLFMQDQDFKTAQKHFARAAELGEHDGRTHGLMGFAYLSQENYIAAEEAYRDAIQQEPDVKDWRLGLARVLLATERFGEAVALFDNLIQENPTDDTLWLLQSNAYLGMGKPLEAVVNIEAVRALGKPKRESLMLLGDIYLSMEMPSQALDAYREVIDRDEGQSSYSTIFRAANLLYQTRNNREAADLLDSIEVKYADSLDVNKELELLTLKAKIARINGDNDQAAEILKSIVRRDGTRGEALIELAEYYRDQGKLEEALMYITQAEGLEKFEAKALAKHAQMLVKQRKYAEAAGLLQRSLNLKPDPRVERFLEQVKRASLR